MTRVPGPSHPNWRKLLVREIAPELSSLPARIVVSKLRLQLAVDRSDAKVSQYVDELVQVFARSVENPSIQRDLVSIFGTGELE